MNMHIKSNITQTATNLWEFVNDFEVGNVAELELDMDEINALDNKVIRGKIKAAIVKAKRASK